MDDLTIARETNRRLNRRLGDMEHHMHSLVSAAQNEAAKAQKLAAYAMETARMSASDHWKRSEQVRDQARTIDRIAMWLFVVSVWAVGSTAAAVWCATR